MEKFAPKMIYTPFPQAIHTFIVKKHSLSTWLCTTCGRNSCNFRQKLFFIPKLIHTIHVKMWTKSEQKVEN